MTRIDLLSLTISGFASFCQPTTINFNTTPGLKYLTGINRVEPRLGANGCGKSSLWEALCWCLWGSTTNGERAGALRNLACEKASVSATLSISGEECVISRSAPPNRLTINGDPAEQPAVAGLLGISRERFIHAVIFGQAASMFLDLPVASRGELLEEVLPLAVWSDAADHATKQTAKLEEQLKNAEREEAYRRGRLEALPSVDEMREKLARWDANLAEAMQMVVAEAEKIEKRLQVARAKQDETADGLKRIKRAPVDRPDDRRLRELRDRLAVARAKADEFDKMADFLQDNTVCPTCGQALSKHLRTKGLEECQAEGRKLRASIGRMRLDADEHEEAFKTQQEAYYRYAQKLSQAELDARTADGEVRALENMLEASVARAEEMAEQKNPYKDELSSLKARRREAKAALGEASATVVELRDQCGKVGYWKQGFRRVRLFVIKTILQRLELEIDNAAALLGIGDWRIRLVTGETTKQGTIRDGVRIQVTPPGAKETQALWSGGETQRIKLAISLGLASLIQAMAGVNFGFEVWDEPSAWLSTEGIEDLLDALSTHAQQSRRSVWLLDHRQLGVSNFQETYWIIKEPSGSFITDQAPG